MRYQKYKNLPAIIIFSSFLIIGIIIFEDYGISWDEPYHRINGFVSLNFIRKIFFLDIYPGLVHDSKFLAEGSKLYGVLFDLPMAFIEKKLFIDDSRYYFLIRHFFNFFIFFIASIFFFLILKKRFSNKLSIIGLLFLILSPRIFAESFYNMKDLIFLSFFVISLYFVINFLDSPSYKNALLSALTCSFVVDVRILGIISPFIVIVFFILMFMDNKYFFKKNILKVVTFLSLVIFFTILFWPYLWNDPLTKFLHTLKDMSYHLWPGSVFYFGKHISALNLPWHYPIVWISISVPIMYLLFFILGSFLIIRRLFNRFLNLSTKDNFNELWRGNKERMDIIFFIIFYFTLLLVLELKPVLYGGWRHLYFIYPCLIYISIRGLEFISRKFSFKYLIIMIAPFLLYTSIWMLKNHPYQFVYFNIFAGKNATNNFDLDHWGASNKSVLTYIVTNDTRDKLNIYVSSESPYHFSLLLMNKDERKRLNFVDNIKKADFLVTNHYYQKGNPIIINQKLKKKFKLFKEFKVDDIIINSIYKIN
jgi:hypothetical protein|tara:strand:+ start:122 stop:1723 length:1602 start_codon:yes stop_codon:yes gene_type:complete